MALRISRRVCTLGRPGALGAGTKGSMWNHSASDKSVWYALLMLGTLPSHYLRTPFRTVSLKRSKRGRSSAWTALLAPAGRRNRASLLVWSTRRASFRALSGLFGQFLSAIGRI